MLPLLANHKAFLHCNTTADQFIVISTFPQIESGLSMKYNLVGGLDFFGSPPSSLNIVHL